jgi:tetratricopeptide (TPR) repeat protein
VTWQLAHHGAVHVRIPPSRALYQEPYFKCLNSGTLSLRCDNPWWNLHIQREGFPGAPDPAGPLSVTTPQQARTLGNARYASKDYAAAVEVYTEGLALQPGPELRVTLLANRAAAALAMRQHAYALGGCEQVLQEDPGA